MSTNKNQESQLIVKVLSDLEISSDIFNGQETIKMFRDMKFAMDNAKTSADKARLAKQAVDGGSFLGNWWHNRKDALRDAQHDLSLAVVNLSENNSKLLVFNTAISKMLLDAQYQLHEQQKQLERQAKKLEGHTYDLFEQNKRLEDTNKKLSEEQKRLDNLVQDVATIKGLSQDNIIKLANLVKNAESLNEELKESFKKERNSLSQSLVVAEMELTSRYNAIKNDFDNIEKSISEIFLSIKETHDLIDKNKNELDGNISNTKDLLMENIGILDNKNKELQENFNSNKISFDSEINKVNENLEDMQLSLKNNKQELLDGLNNQQKTMDDKEKEIYEKMSKIEKYLIDEIGLLDSNTSDKIDNQKTVIMDSVIELSNFVNNDNKNIRIELSSLYDNVRSDIVKIERKFSNDSKDIKQLVDVGRENFENELIAIQDYFYYELDKLKKICLVLFVLLVLVVIGFGAYLYLL